MKITIDTTETLDQVDRDILRLLIGLDTARVPEAGQVSKTKTDPGTPASDLTLNGDPEPAPSKEAVAKRAQELITSGERDTVKDALASVGVSRVRDLSDEQVVAVLKALG